MTSLLSLIATGGQAIADRPDFSREEETTTYLDGVTRYRNLTYLEGERRDWYRHRLDLYIPGEENWAEGRPMVMWIHGGAWFLGYKDDFDGLYGRIGRMFTSHGIAFANINYRLTPRVQHPGHIEDCAAAFAWLYEQSDTYGYDRNNMFVTGHSAGGHLAALLAVDPQWLAAHDLNASEVIAGAMPCSGVYDIENMYRMVDQVDENLNRMTGKRWRKKRNKDDDEKEETSVVYIDREGGPLVFPVGSGPLGRRIPNPFPTTMLKDASPINHLNVNDPPFLIIHETAGFGDAIGRQSRRFDNALEQVDVEHEILAVENENHLTILLEMLRPNNNVIGSMVEFITRHTDTESTETVERASRP